MYAVASSAAVDGSVTKIRRSDAAATAHDMRMHSSERLMPGRKRILCENKKLLLHSSAQRLPPPEAAVY